MNLWSRLTSRPSPFVGIADTKPFVLRLAQTIAWCAPRADVANPLECLRYDQLRPRLLEVDRGASVRGVVSHRETYVDRSLAPVTSVDGLAGGRLLAYYPDAELSDGAAEFETRGYFDVNNTPPWDTWVALFGDPSVTIDSYRVFLIAWVPPAFLDLVVRGIEVNPESCIAWLADVQFPVARQLQALLEPR